ncbi:hypothetical protein TIFTF001_002958 [Ficus carica]|uniref:PGG domain-containing protein n=1 Tax=Ficus carica TaxID=3494 RepID=A0AA87ZD77_FICCA|nr:hypothetical protein TIFTF001_002958 [Ficus carica]
MLRRLKSSNSPLQANPKCSLRSKVSFDERLLISIFRFKKNNTDDTRNLLLVVAVLVATATYQAALSPPWRCLAGQQVQQQQCHSQ